MNMLVIRLLVAAGALGLNPAFASDDVPKSLTAKECIADGASDFSQDGKQFFFTMNFDNNCDKPIICTIDAYIVGICGPTSAHMQFPAMKQIRIHKSFIVKVKAVDGTAQYGRSCNFL